MRRLVADAAAHRPGRRYLIQHSAGSGKTFTIAWLAHRLATLHDGADARVFDLIVVITDRRVLDRQLHAITEKVKICVEHFAAQVQNEIGGKAKAMIVTRSRMHAVRYRLAIDKYLAEQDYPFKALVAFSGSVPDGGKNYTEANMNGFSEVQTARTFDTADYRFLIVANKFQTGFDQPLLHTMYVDKKLAGVNAVQTLSRLNRTLPPLKTGVSGARLRQRRRRHRHRA